jgi:hypothetical protein
MSRGYCVGSLEKLLKREQTTSANLLLLLLSLLDWNLGNMAGIPSANLILWSDIENGSQAQ